MYIEGDVMGVRIEVLGIGLHDLYMEGIEIFGYQME